MRILGIDPGTNYTGWAIIEYYNHHPKLIASGTITANSKQTYYQKITAIDQALKKIIADYNPVRANIEESFVNVNPKTSLILAMTRGAIILTLLQATLQILTLTPNEVKKSITGSGKADKQQVIKMIELILKITPKTDDEADAIALALYKTNF